MGRRWFVTITSPTPGRTLPSQTRQCSMDMNSPGFAALNAQQSTTWVP